MVFFSLGWTPLQALYPAEVLSYENRAKGLALQSWCTSAVSTINTFGLPPALERVGYVSESGASSCCCLPGNSCNGSALIPRSSVPRLLRLGHYWRCCRLAVCGRDEAIDARGD